MNDHDVMARLAAANPVPAGAGDDGQISSRGLFLLRSILARPRRSHPAWRWTLVPAGLAAAVAVAVVVTNGLATPPAPPVVPSAATPQTIFSAAAERAVQDTPQGEFVHVTGTVGRVVHRSSAGGYNLIRVDAVQSMHPADGLPGEGWLTVGEGGSSVRPLTAADAAAYRRDGSPPASEVEDDPTLYPNLAGDRGFDGDVSTLPDDPAQAGAAMLASAAGTADPTGWLFREGTKLLDTFTEVVGGDGRAKVYRMLAGLAGVRTLDATTDPLGRPAVGLAYTAPTARYGTVEWQIFLAAGSDQISFSQAVVRAPGPANAGLTAGAVQYSTAVTSVTWSDKP